MGSSTRLRPTRFTLCCFLYYSVAEQVWFFMVSSWKRTLSKTVLVDARTGALYSNALTAAALSVFLRVRLQSVRSVMDSAWRLKKLPGADSPRQVVFSCS